MRWSKRTENGMEFIRSLAQVELEAGQMSGIECHAKDKDGNRIDSCGKCDECRTREDGWLALEYID
jgi:7-cyano-7-deazaguanine synthase in queuosine biosynthesis